MQIILINSFFLLLAIARTEGLGKIWEVDHFSRSERTMKTILESCYENESLSNPTVIFGDFNEFNDKTSIIRMKFDREVIKNYKKYESLRFKTTRSILIEDSSIILMANVKLLKVTKLWDHMAPFFIIGKNTTSCESSTKVLDTMSKMKILNSIYICAQSINNTSALYTFNPIANYAPQPWERVGKAVDLNIFRQVFHPNVSCKSLMYDKTIFLNGYEIKAVTWKLPPQAWVSGKNYFEELAESSVIEDKILQVIIAALNASGKVEVETEIGLMKKRFLASSSDMILVSYTINSFDGTPFLFPHKMGEMIAVVKMNSEMPTLDKILKLWSPPVLILAFGALTILFLVLMMKNRDISIAMLDLTRLLTYTSIQTNDRHSAFRIYFTSMLIFMVISNGVFQGKIAAFLSTQERISPVRTIDKLLKLGYKMYASTETANFAKMNCPKCKFEEVPLEACLEYVLNGTLNVCAMRTRRYEEKSAEFPLAHVEEILNREFQNLKCRDDWPLHDRVNDIIMRLFESGIIAFWEIERSYRPKQKRKAMEAEWSLPKYRPVRLIKLKFAFQLLGLGLSLATIVFFLELLVGRYKTPKR